MVLRALAKFDPVAPPTFTRNVVAARWAAGTMPAARNSPHTVAAEAALTSAAAAEAAGPTSVVLAVVVAVVMPASPTVDVVAS